MKCSKASKCFENLGRASWDRNQVVQKAQTVLRPQTSVPGTQGNQYWRNGAGKDGSKWTERLWTQPRQFHHREVQNLLLSVCRLFSPCLRRSQETLPQQSYILYLTKGIHSRVLSVNEAKKDQSQQLYKKRLLSQLNRSFAKYQCYLFKQLWPFFDADVV